MNLSGIKIKAAVCAVLTLSISALFGISSVLDKKTDVNADGILTGDINKDGSVNAADFSLLVNYLLGKSAAADSAAADLSGDGRINIIDAIYLKSILINSETSSKDDDQDKVSSTVITLMENTAKISGEGASVSENVITVSAPGTYSISGKLSDGQIIVNVDKEKYPDGKVELSLEGAKIYSENNSPVYIGEIGDECVITVKKGTENIISDGKEYTNSDEDSGAVYSKDDLKIKGKGKLTINGNCSDGIVCKDSLKIFNGNIIVNAADDGIRAKDSVKIGNVDDDDYTDLSLTVNSESGDGIKATNDTEEDKGNVIINGGTVKVTAFSEGISGQSVAINGGDIDIYTYQGSAYQNGSTQTNQTNQRGGFMMDGNSGKMPSDMSAKGIKSSGVTDITGGNIKIDSSDDSIHSAGNLTITGGVFELRSADDGLHSDADIVIGAGTSDTYDDVMIYIPKCYEGVEGMNITQNSGTVIVYSDDDGFNAAGGADGSGMGGPGGWEQGGWNQGGGFGGERPQRPADDSEGRFNRDPSENFGNGSPEEFGGRFQGDFGDRPPEDFGGGFSGDFGERPPADFNGGSMNNPGGDFQGKGGFPGEGGGDYSLNLLGGLAFVSTADGDHDGFDSNGDITIDGAITISNGNEAYDCDGTKKFVSGTYVEVSGNGGGRGFGFGGQSEGFDASFTSEIKASKGDRITVKDSMGNVIVSFEAGKAATKISVGSKTVSEGTVTIGGTVSDAKALPVTGDSQQIFVSK